MTERRSLFWPALLLALITIVVFSPILRNDFIGVWDDDKYIANNPDYNPPTFGKLVHYWVPPPKDEFFVPVLYTTWGIISMFARTVAPSGLVTFHAAPFHALSIGAHTGSVLLVFAILVRLFRSRAGAFFGAIVFALHPTQLESVAWASTAYTPMCGMFCLLAIWQFLAAADADESLRTRSFAWHYGLASFAFLLAMLTKPAALSVPLMIAAIEIALRKRPWRKLVVPLGAWIVFAVVVVSITRSALPAATAGEHNPLATLAIALDAIAFYLYRVVWPLHVCIDYGRTPNRILGQLDLFHPTTLWRLLIPVAVGLITYLLRRRVPVLWGGLGVFVAALLPTIGLAPFTFQIFSTVADRYAYLAMFALALVLAVGAARLPAIITTILTICVACGLAILTHYGIPKWQNEWTLFSWTLHTNPNSQIVATDLRFMFTSEEQATCNLSADQLEQMGDHLVQQKRSKLACDLYEMAVAREPLSRTYVKLAEARLQTEQPVAALKAANMGMRLSPVNPAAPAVFNEAWEASQKHR